MIRGLVLFAQLSVVTDARTQAEGAASRRSYVNMFCYEEPLLCRRTELQSGFYEGAPWG